VIAGPPKQLVVTVQDSDHGLMHIEVTDATNTTVDVPSFSAGEKGAIIVKATKVDPSAGSRLALHVMDMNGTAIDCDPIVPGEAAASNKPQQESSGGCSVGRTSSAAGLTGLIGALAGLALLRRRAQRKQ
jgi:hypothetical protein